MNDEGKKGHLHPITSVIREIAMIFDKIGFSVAQGPELENEFYNFDALNVPPDHPARDMQDTFWVKRAKDNVVRGDLDPRLRSTSLRYEGLARMTQRESIDNQRLVLRTHTSSVQVRFMESIKDDPKPFKIIVPGKVYRNEATDVTHEAQFYQIEGLYINDKVSIAELKWTLEYFFKEFLGPEAKIRFRPSYFGFVEPGVEVIVWWQDKKGNGKWLELFGAGLVHPHVIRSSGLDPDKWQGFAFGGGIDRLVMLRYGIDDIRHLYSGDLRLISQF